MAKINMPKMDIGSELNDVKSEINGQFDINNMINGKINDVQNIANKAGINIKLPKVNIPTGDITKSITGSFGDVEKTIADSQNQINSMDVDIDDNLLKEAGLNGISFG